MTFEKWWEKSCASAIRVFNNKMDAKYIYEAGQASAIAENKAEYNLGVRDGYEKAREQAVDIAICETIGGNMYGIAEAIREMK